MSALANRAKELRALIVAGRDLVDARRHPSRHATAMRRLGALRPRSLLFVCLGNICRSPYAEVAMRAKVGDLTIGSGGFILPGRQPPIEALMSATSRGVRHESHRSRLVTAAEAANSDAVMVFDRFNVRDLRRHKLLSTGAHLFWLGDFDPLWSGKRAIVDPWGGSPDDFDRTFTRIDRCLDQIATVLGR